MARPSPVPLHPLSLASDDDAGDPPHHFIPRVTGLPIFQLNEESATGASPSAAGDSHMTVPRQPTLFERREKRHCNASFPSLNAETLQSDCRENVSRGEDGSSVFRGWSKTNIGKNLRTSSMREAVKILSYNILAQRLVSTDRYPHCPVFALAEDYRGSLLQKELRNASPDIIALQEISVDMFERPDMLGGWLRSNLGYAGDHLVITDAAGRPRSWSDKLHEDSRSNCTTDETDVASPKLERQNAPNTATNSYDQDGFSHRHAEMEGVCIFYLKNRFEPCEVVPIRFNEIAAADSRLLPRERRFLQVCSHNVALITVLRDRVMPNKIYVVGTVHLIWQRTECQLWQMHHILHTMECLKEKYEKCILGEGGDKPLVSVILSGDFNAEPNSPPVRYALDGAPPPGSNVVKCWRVPDSDRDAEYGGTDGGSPTVSSSSGGVVEGGNLEDTTQKQYHITHTINHGLSLHDCYATYRERYPRRVSAVNPSTNGEGKVLDHIFLDEQHVACTAVLRLAGHAELPRRDCPSDHYPVGVIIVPRSLLP
ncbi:endonuclease/exonuclease/phosphatase [Trypanosoma grayi]|uniref:endonuclease/exonuclease/phosphatase n=1 Tax=Trypanosoma grayi TaxID=71804 RepID=UPI0004F458F8|nr:endonuclease/exonuclease/phosphatase [Trypanosoma grayi]KEG14095.1 endonuclease/exonuclease/phosphatase [Trypanosoma grayi]